MCWVKSCLNSKRAEVESFAEIVGITKLIIARIVKIRELQRDPNEFSK